MKFKKGLIIFLAMLMALPFFAGCKKKNKTTYDNERDAFVMSIQELDEVFNPFFVTSGYDSQVVGMTQIGLMTADEDGEIVCGDEYATIAKAYSKVETGSKDPIDPDNYTNFYTTYQFLLKNNLKYSDGSPLTWKDILFNFYFYLDPAYTGSTTMYSTKIKGLREYRTQTESAAQAIINEQNATIRGESRMNVILNYANSNSLPLERVGSDDDKEMFDDIKRLEGYYFDELVSDWAYAASAFEDVKKEIPQIDTAWKNFFVNQGYIELKTENNVTTVQDWGGLQNFIKSNMTADEIKDACIDYVYTDIITYPFEDAVGGEVEEYNKNISLILQYKGAGVNALNYFIADEKYKIVQEIREENEGRLAVDKISGINVIPNVRSFNTGSQTLTLTENHFVFEVVVNGIDPKAIHNFSISIAPMKYYGSPEMFNVPIEGLSQSDYNPSKETNFGLDFNSPASMDKARAQDVPIGAGAYKASSATNADGNVTKREFWSNYVVYYIRNEHFMLGKPVMKFVRYQVINKTQIMGMLTTGKIHFGDPDAITVNYNEANRNSSTLAIDDPLNLGYGYIGINASLVTNIHVRRAIMHAMDTSLAVKTYYTNDSATIIHRPMSSVIEWAYPKDETARYPFDSTGNASRQCLEEAGFSWTSNNVLLDEMGRVAPKVTLTLAGSGNEHPMYNTMVEAKRILNALGMTVDVVSDSGALRKLTKGELQVWAAAWGSTIDPDMYQVYHKDSTATSVLNWGFKEILKDEARAEEQTLVNNLATFIERARETDDKIARAKEYRDALNTLMDLAVELPTYQRKNLYVYNKTVIDQRTLPSRTTPFYGLLSEIWNISLVTE